MKNLREELDGIMCDFDRLNIRLTELSLLISTPTIKKADYNRIQEVHRKVREFYRRFEQFDFEACGQYEDDPVNLRAEVE